jgi:hypothetical protein
MAYPIEVPVVSGARLLVAKSTTEVHFPDTLVWKRNGPDADTAKAAGDAGH